MQQITASQTVKKAGFRSMKEVSEMTGLSHQTLVNWFNNRRQVFDLLILGCISHRQAD